MEYSIVIATRNRAKALALSIPRMLAQSRPPAQLIVVDSSRDHDEIEKLVAAASRQSRAEVIVRKSEPGLTLQRNLGLQFVRSPIILFPDDDSIWYADTAETLMEVYERDTAGKIAAVCSHESPAPPDFQPTTASEDIYSMRTGDQLRSKYARCLLMIERSLARNPLQIIGSEFCSSHVPEEWERSLEVTPVEWMTGFRMSFRTEAILHCGFEKTFSNYSICEDIDASFGAWNRGAVVGAGKSRVFHFKSPERRGNGWDIGVQQLLNLAFVVAKHTPVGHPARRALPGFARYKSYLCFLGARNAYGRDRLRGILRAVRQVPEFVLASQKDLPYVYKTALTFCSDGKPK
jgi:GT2 family glycosyltransferase